MPLTDVEKPKVKMEAAELASIFYDVLDAVKNAPPAYRQMVDEHKVLKATKAEHQKILDDTCKALDEHKSSKAAWFVEQQRDKLEREKHAKELSEREDRLSKLATSLNVRDAALGRKDKEQKEKQALQDAKDKAQAEKDATQAKRHADLKAWEERLAAQDNILRAKHDKLKEVMG